MDDGLDLFTKSCLNKKLKFMMRSRFIQLSSFYFSDSRNNPFAFKSPVTDTMNVVCKEMSVN